MEETHLLMGMLMRKIGSWRPTIKCMKKRKKGERRRGRGGRHW